MLPLMPHIMLLVFLEKSTSRHMVRVLEYIEGDIMDGNCITPKLLRQAGEMVANMQMIWEVTS